MQYVSNVCLATVITVQYVLLYGLYEYVREVDNRCATLGTAIHRSRRDVNIAENSVSTKNEGVGKKIDFSNPNLRSVVEKETKADEDGKNVEFINPNLRPVVEKETNSKGANQPNGTREEWYWLNAYSRIPVSIFRERIINIIHSYYK